MILSVWISRISLFFFLIILDASSANWDDITYVVQLTGDNFESEMHNKDYAILLQLHSSICADCIRFAPIWDDLSRDVKYWQDVIRLKSIDCFRPDAAEICGIYNDENELPLVKYIKPFQENGDDYIGDTLISDVDGMDVESMVALVVEQLCGEEEMENWPLLEKLESANIDLYDLLGGDIEYIFLLMATEDSDEFEVQAVILDFSLFKNIKIFNVTPYADRDVGIIEILESNNLTSFYKSTNWERDPIREAILGWLDEKDIDMPDVTFPPQIIEITGPCPQNIRKDMIYRADLEMALCESIFHEIPRQGLIENDALVGLKTFLKLIQMYFPFDTPNDINFIQALLNYLDEFETITGTAFQIQANKLKLCYDPIFNSRGYMGCCSNIPRLRGYSCGLWQLFHMLTVSSAANAAEDEPLEVLAPMFYYVKYFYSCRSCQMLFEEVADSEQLFLVSTKEQAIQWLWNAHNLVNLEIQGDPTEDPKHPKKEFPTTTLCKKCHGKHDWMEANVNEYIKGFYSNLN